MKETEKNYTAPQLQLLDLCASVPIMLSYDTDPNQSTWELLMREAKISNQNA